MKNGRKRVKDSAAALPAAPVVVGQEPFIRVSVTLPRTVGELADKAAQHPRWAGNRSAFIRGLVIDHLMKENPEVCLSSNS